MESNKQYLKSLSMGGSAPQKQPNALSKIRQATMKHLKTVKAKQVADVTLFAAAIFIMYQFGRVIGNAIDNQMPSEKSMMDMMRQYGGAPGMPPPPM